MVRGIRKKDYERLDDATIARVVLLLEQEKPITKKAACEILNISYSTPRLNRIIEEYKDKIEYTKKRLKANKGKDFGDLELKDLVISYLSGDSIASISKSLYRSKHAIKSKIEELHLPIRDKTADYFNPKMMPDEMVSESFDKGEYVWSTRYNCVVEIMSHTIYKEVNSRPLYHIYIFGKYMQFGSQLAEELGKLEILKQFKLRDDEFRTSQNFDYRIE